MGVFDFVGAGGFWALRGATNGIGAVVMVEPPRIWGVLTRVLACAPAYSIYVSLCVPMYLLLMPHGTWKRITQRCSR